MSFGKLFGTMVTVLVVFELWVVGYDCGQHHYADAVYNAIIVAFWLIIGTTMVFADRKHNREMEKLDAEIKQKTEKMLTELLNGGQKSDPEAARLTGVMETIVSKYNLGPNKLPTINEIEAMEIEFNELTGKYARVTARTHGLDVNMGDRPFPPRVPTKKPRKRPETMKPLPKKAAKTGRKIAVKKK